jgi:hypothetical protein
MRRRGRVQQDAMFERSALHGRAPSVRLRICAASSLAASSRTSRSSPGLEMPSESTVVRATTVTDLLLVRLVVRGATHRGGGAEGEEGGRPKRGEDCAREAHDRLPISHAHQLRARGVHPLLHSLALAGSYRTRTVSRSVERLSRSARSSSHARGCIGVCYLSCIDSLACPRIGAPSSFGAPSSVRRATIRERGPSPEGATAPHRATDERYDQHTESTRTRARAIAADDGARVSPIDPRSAARA